ncbi:MAG: hypothetical protein ABFC42_10360 [Sulfuricella sp.]
MADYQCWPLWEASPGQVGNIDPNDLPISQGLRERLLEWAFTYDRTLNMADPISSGFKSAEAEVKFKRQGHELVEQLRKELGSGFVVTVKL